MIVKGAIVVIIASNPYRESHSWVQMNIITFMTLLEEIYRHASSYIPLKRATAIGRGSSVWYTSDIIAQMAKAGTGGNTSLPESMGNL